MPTITIKAGDTLSVLAQKYGTTVAELAKLNGIANPNMIRAGASLSIPDIAGTLATGTATPPAPIAPSLPAQSPISQQNAPTGAVQTPEKALPTVAPTHLSIFQSMMREAVNEGVKKSRASGVATAQNFFPDSSKMSGGTFAGVIDMVNNSSTQGVADIYKSTIDLLNTQQATAENHLKTLIESKALAQMDDKTLIKLANTSGMDYDSLAALKNQQVEEAKAPKSFDTITTGGRQVRYGFDSAGNIVSQQDLGGVDKASGGGSLPGSYQEWTLAGGEEGTGMSYAKYLMGGKKGEDKDTAVVDSLNDTKLTIDTLIADNKTVGKVVNKGMWTKAFPLAWERMAFDEKNYIAGVEQLVSKNTIDTLIASKAQGATYGALSDGERQMLRSAASKIGSWTMKDDSENVLGYSIDEVSFLKELNKIKTLTETAIKNAGGSDQKPLENKNPEVNSLRKKYDY